VRRARAYEAHVKAFFEEDLLVRYTGDILAPAAADRQPRTDRPDRGGLRSVLERID
jgi:hypothetical protein